MEPSLPSILGSRDLANLFCCKQGSCNQYNPLHKCTCLTLESRGQDEEDFLPPTSPGPGTAQQEQQAMPFRKHTPWELPHSGPKVITFLNYYCFASCYMSCPRLNLAADFPQPF